MIERRFALIIATSKYTDPELRKLISPGEDAKALEAVLKNPEIGAFDVKILLNKPTYEVNEEINIFFNDRQRNDLLLLYFSCHGIKDIDGRLYFASINTNRKRLASTAVSANFVNDMMLASRSRCQVLILDCCNSGAFAKGAVAKTDEHIHTGDYFEGKGRVVLTASDSMQYSFEENSRKGVGKRSIFTSAIVHGLETGHADLDKDGRISYDELYDYAYERVTYETPTQTPGIWVFGVEGDLVIAKNPKYATNAIPVEHVKAKPPSEEPVKVEPAPAPVQVPELVKWKRRIPLIIAVGSGLIIVFALLMFPVLYQLPQPTKVNVTTPQPTPKPTPHPTTIPTQPKAEKQQNYSFVRAWGSPGSGDGQFNSPTGVAVDSSGNVYVADSLNNRTQKFTSNGKFITKWGSEGNDTGQFSNPTGVAVDPSGNVYVADWDNDRIQEFTYDGKFITKWGSYGEGKGEFNGPEDVAVDSSGNVYVADYVNDRVQKFTNNGKFITMWGTLGSGKGQLVNPSGIAVDSSGYVYVVDAGNNRIQKFTNNGKFITEWGSSGSEEGQFNSPTGVAVDSSGNVYVADSGNFRIQKFTNNGKFITKWGSYGEGKGEIYGPEDVAVDSSDQVYVADGDKNQVQVFSQGFQDNNISPINDTSNAASNAAVKGQAVKCESQICFVRVWGSPGSGEGQFNFPNGVAVDSSDEVYVADSGNSRIQKFLGDGKFITEWGSSGSGKVQFNYPEGVAIDSSGYVYVVDAGNDRIQKFTSDRKFITEWGSSGSEEGQFNSPTGVAVDSSGNVYVADLSNNRIQKFTSDGKFITEWGSSGSEEGQFNSPTGVAVDSSGNVYVADSLNNRTQKFTSNGKFIIKWGSEGNDTGQFISPSGLAIDSSDEVYVADSGNSRIQVFRQTAAESPVRPEPQQQMIPENTTKITNNPSLPSYGAELSGNNEVPPKRSDATGKASFEIIGNTMSYEINLIGITGATATGAHIHSAAEGKNGEVVADLLNTPQSKDKDTPKGMIVRGNITDSSLEGPLQGKTLDDLTALMDSGKAYVNVHTVDNKDGEIRGQIANEDKPSGTTN